MLVYSSNNGKLIIQLEWPKVARSVHMICPCASEMMYNQIPRPPNFEIL